jgi:hypothetical protein
MTKFKQIAELEAQKTAFNKAIDNQIKALKSAQKLKRGDYVVALNSVEWSYTKGTRYWVDEVNASHIFIRSEDAKSRENYVFWMTNSDWIKDE